MRTQAWLRRPGRKSAAVNNRFYNFLERSARYSCSVKGFGLRPNGSLEDYYDLILLNGLKLAAADLRLGHLSALQPVRDELHREWQSP